MLALAGLLPVERRLDTVSWACCRVCRNRPIAPGAGGEGELEVFDGETLYVLAVALSVSVLDTICEKKGNKVQ